MRRVVISTCSVRSSASRRCGRGCRRSARHRRRWKHGSRERHAALTLTTVGEFRPFSRGRMTGAPDDARAARAGRSAGRGDPGGPQRGTTARRRSGPLDRLLREGARIVALTNSGAQQTEEILEQAKLRGASSRFSAFPTSASTSRTAAYAHVVSERGVAAAEATLVAAHAWDVVGARGGARDDWMDRRERRWPLPVPEPPRAASLAVAVEVLAIGS
jgi:hypothetical protein